MKKINFSVKVIFIIAIIVLTILMLSYDEDPDDADNFRLGFPITQLEFETNDTISQSSKTQYINIIAKENHKKVKS